MKAELILFICISITQVAVVYALLNSPSAEHMQMRGYDYMPKNVSGVYIPGCAYIVDVRGRNFEDINRTDKHESCHAFINEDQENHFCR